MKKKILFVSALLASALALPIHSAMAVALGYTSNAEAYAEGNSTAGSTFAHTVGPMSSATAMVDGFTLHSYSEVTELFSDIDALHDVPAVNRTVVQPSVFASGSASFSQTFRVNSAGTASLHFAWDGELFSARDGYNARYDFFAVAQAGTQLFGRIDTGDIVFNEGSSSVNQTRKINLLFTGGDVGTLFTVSAQLSTSAGTELFNQASYFNDLASIALVPVIDGPVSRPLAYADFTDTATFSFNGQGVISVVPVPAAVWLLGSALLGLAGFRRARSDSSVTG